MKNDSIEDFYKEHKKDKKQEKPTKCQLAKKNCKHWEVDKQKCLKGVCAI